METNIYRLLQRHLDYMPVPFPETESGVEIRLLKRLFTEKEAALALCLNAIPEPVGKIFKRWKKTRYRRCHSICVSSQRYAGFL